MDRERRGRAVCDLFEDDQTVRWSRCDELLGMFARLT